MTAVIITIKKADEKQIAVINQFLEQNASKVSLINAYATKFKVWRVTYISVYYSSK